MKSLRKCMFGLMILGVLGMTSCNDSGNSGTDAGITPDSDNVTSSHAIINGEPDMEKMHNAVVSLYLSYANHSLCTGTLIHPQWVLTAAHCVAEVDSKNHRKLNKYAPYLSIAIGNNLEELANHQYPIDKIYYHPKYSIGGKNDIALIKLSEHIPESVAYPIPPLHPNDGVTREQIESEGVPVTLVGFGQNENADSGVKLKLDSYMTSYCGAANNDNTQGCYYGKIYLNGCEPSGSPCYKNEPYEVEIPFGSIYYDQTQGGLCYGDSGGPALVYTSTFPGIAVAGISSGSVCTSFGVQTAVQDFYDSFIMKYAPEVKDYHDAKFLKAVSAANEGYCNDDHFTVCKLYNNYDEFVSCSIDEDKSWQCGLFCFINEPNCSERCTDGIITCDDTGTGLRTCVEGKWSEPELCPTDTPYCNYNRCRTSAVDWCTFHWMETSTENSTATGYGRILNPYIILGGPEDIRTAYMACTDDITKPVSEWTRMNAEFNQYCSDCGDNYEYISSTYQALSGNNYCTFVFEYNNEVIACRPQQDGDSEPIPIHSDTTLDIKNTRVFVNE